MILTGKSGEREERCLKRARKQYDTLKKWGKLGGCFYAFGGAAYICIGFILIWLLQRMVEGLLNNPNNNQAQNAVAQGFALGMVLGFLLIVLAVKGIYYLIQGIKYIRNDPSDHLLVLCHDLLMKLKENNPELSETGEKNHTS